mgnify:CR=1 FL=1
MSKKKHSVLGMAALAAAGAGAAVLANKSREEKQITEAHVDPNYRNTERGKNEKNSKGIYYTNGNYEAFARPEKPEGVDDKHAYLVGSGLASLAAACFLVRDAQMPGDHIHILESMDIAGGACDGIFDTLCEAAVRWKTISSASGIFSIAFHLWKNQVPPFWTSTTG